MVKWKFFTSMYEEIEWLESMARQGWMLSDINLGVRYTFTQCEPAEMVYEVENFALSFSKNAKKQELEAQRTASDLIEQTGWKLVARDEGMSSYYVKERTNDGYNELYDDVESRRLRAEKYRTLYCIEQPKELMKLTLIMTIFSIFIALVDFDRGFLIFDLVYTLLMVGMSLYSIYGGELIYRELCMSRAEWKERKKNSMKYTFKRSEDLLTYLQQRDKADLKLVECEGNTYIFEPSREHYRYYMDTKSALKQRMKQKRQKYQEDWKDMNQIGTRWHEVSMQEAKELGMEVVCTVKNGTLIYRCPESKAVDWNTNVTKLTGPLDGWMPYLGAGVGLGAVLGIIWAIMDMM